MFPSKITCKIGEAPHLNHSSDPGQPVTLGSEQQNKITTVLEAKPSNPQGLQERIHFPFLDLPENVLSVFFQCLQIKDVFAFSQVCKSLSLFACARIKSHDLAIQQNLLNGIYSTNGIRGKGVYIFPFVIGNGKLYSCTNNKIAIQDLKTGQSLDSLKRHQIDVVSLAISHSTEVLCSGDWHGKVMVWDVKTGECKHILKRSKVNVCCLVIEDGKVYASFADCKIVVWDIKTGKRLASLRNGQTDLNSLAVRDGRIYTTSNENTIQILDEKKKKRLFTLKGHQHLVSSLAFVGKKLCSGSWDKTIKVWDGHTCLATLKGHEAKINSLVDFRGLLCSSSSDKTIKFWNIEKAECLFTLYGHGNAVFPLFVSNHKLYSADEAAVVRVWDFTAEHCVVLRELAGLLRSGEEDAINQAKARLSRMPEQINAIYGQSGEGSTPLQLAEAIERYLGD